MPPIIPPSLFESLQSTIDDDTSTRESLRDIIQTLEKQLKKALAHLTNAASLPQTQRASAIHAVEADLLPPALASIQTLNQAASQHPYYKFNGMWTRCMQDAAQAVLQIAYHTQGALLQLDQVAAKLGVPGPEAGSDAAAADRFHLTTEEYLHAVLSLVDDLARLSKTCVTQHDYATPLQISQFVKDIHAGFQVLNLKNDSLRKRSDGVKYRLRETEDVVYDLSLRGLIQDGDAAAADEAKRQKQGA